MYFRILVDIVYFTHFDLIIIFQNGTVNNNKSSAKLSGAHVTIWESQSILTILLYLILTEAVKI